MKSLYRRYRPLSLADVVGQEQVVKPLENALKSQKIGHAYLFTGPRGTGKTSVARIFAHAVNGFDYELEDNYIDIVEIDGASNRGIDDVREIREKAAIKPSAGKYKVYIIDEVHMLTKEAFNALLKTLEEPPKHVIFIMATTDIHKVPATILSRAQTFNFKLADEKIIFDHLKSICAKEKIKIEDAALKLIVRRGGGSFRDSLSLLDQISTLSDQTITEEMVEKTFGLPEDQEIDELLKNYILSNLNATVDCLKTLLESGVRPEIIAEDLIAKIIAKPDAKLLPLLSLLPDVKEPFAEARLLVALTLNMASAATSTPAQPAPAPSPTPTVATPKAPSNSFDWNDFVEKVKKENSAVSLQLVGAEWKVEDQKLTIYPAKKFAKIILSKPDNLNILMTLANKEIAIEEQNDSLKNDYLSSKISAIMGGEVQEYGGGSPF